MWGLGGVGGAITFMWVAYTSDATLRLHHGLGFGSLCGAITFMWLAYTSDATLLLRHGLGFGWWGGAITFMWLAYTSAATLRLRHGLGFGWWGGAITFMWLAYTSDARYGHVMAWGLVRCVGQKRSCDLRTQVMLCYGYVMACQVCGAHAKLELLIISCFREFVFGNGDGTMEIPTTTWVSPVPP